MTAGKICYDAFGKGRADPKEYLDHIISSGHGSVLEHAQWNFIITGVSRTFSHEHVRHRVGTAISQRSQRYVDESKSPSISQPLINANPEAKKIWEDAVANSKAAYDKLILLISNDLTQASPEASKVEIRKIVRSAARSVMPNATETVIFWSANARTLRHYIQLRGTPEAELEIQRVAKELLSIMKQEAPHLFNDICLKV